MIKKIFKIILIALIVILVLLLLICGLFVYSLKYQVSTVDKQTSADGKYTVYLKSVGEPIFFSDAKGKLELKKEGKQVAYCAFTLADDGGSIRSDIWDVTWETGCVKVRISGSEQDTIEYTLYFEGGTTYTVVSTESDNIDPSILSGYHAICDIYFKDDDFNIEYDAKGNSRIILYEDDDTIRYLVYDCLSDNEQCYLYVYYENEKDSDGSWSILEAHIKDMYAYVYGEDKVIDSGKTSWSDEGSKEYREATGE